MHLAPPNLGLGKTLHGVPELALISLLASDVISLKLCVQSFYRLKSAMVGEFTLSKSASATNQSGLSFTLGSWFSSIYQHTAGTLLSSLHRGQN